MINVMKCPCGFCHWLESRTLGTAPLPERTRVPAGLRTVGLERVGEGRRSAASEVASVPFPTTHPHARSRAALTPRWGAELLCGRPRASRSRGGPVPNFGN